MQDEKRFYKQSQNHVCSVNGPTEAILVDKLYCDTKSRFKTTSLNFSANDTTCKISHQF